MHVQRTTRAVSALVLAAGLILVAVPAMAAAPSPAWTKQFGSTEADYAYGVAVDGANAIYVVGSTDGTITGWPSRGDRDAFVRKVKPDGVKVWTKQFGTAAYDSAKAVAVDRFGKIYVVGDTYGSLSGASKGDSDAFVRKYKPNGKKVWTRQFGTADTDRARGIAVDRSGNVYVVGATDKGDFDAFVRKYKPDGTKVWHRRFGTTGSDFANAVAVDRSGNVYVVGHTYGSLTGSSSGGTDAFVRKYKPNGTKVWTRQFGTTAYDYANAVAVGPDGRIAVAGSTYGSLSGTSKGNSDAFVRKYKPNGSKVWTKQFGTPAYDSASSVAVDWLGRIAVAGLTGGSLQGTSSGQNDAYVRKYKPAGSHAWTSQFGSTGFDDATAVAVDSKLRIIVAGSTTDSITGWPSRGDDDAFVRKYKR